MKIKNLLILLLTVSVLNGCSSGRETVVLSDGWKLWQDKQATWQNDSLYLPSEVVISELAKDAPEPVGGWNVLDGHPDGSVDVCLPAIVEEYLTPDGKVETYMPGVYWFWKDVDIPKSYSGKTVRLNIESSRLRTEVFVNRQLTGYDIVGDIPYSCDLTGALRYGDINRIAIRITNPGGNRRGWEDFPQFNWGKYVLPASRNFGGINGKVELVVTGRTFIEDVYVKNLNTSDYRSIEVQTTVNNQRSGATKAQIKYEIVPVSGGRAVFTATDEILIAGNSLPVFNKQIHCPEAALWNIETPKLYQCRVSVRNSEKTGNDDKINDVFTQKFGFRVFEIKKVEGNNQAHWYVNGKRMIFRGGIDFSYYAYTGAYPTDEAAEKSVLAAKQLGHNAFNFHRRIGYSPVLDKADELGLFLYEEVGGFHTGGQGYDITQSPFASALIIEKLRRMVLRDRNHPSLIIYNLSNEDAQYGETREQALKLVHTLDEARLVVNTSGGSGGGKAPDIQHIRPYEKNIRTDFHDDHTVGSGVLFDENDFKMHVPTDNEHIQYWGEVKCYSAPDNWYETAGMLEKLKSQKTKDYKGYNYSYYTDFSKKLHDFFHEHRIATTGSGVIRTPGDISKAAGNGKMYNEGRNAQNIMSYDRSDGYAINAWSGGNGRETWSGWYSGLVDDGRNIKGDPAIYAYYTRPLQVVIQRRADSIGGKFFDISGTAAFKIKLINHDILSAGNYTLHLKLKDGAGIYHSEYNHSIPVRVQGGDVYAQDIDLAYIVPMNERLHGGFITLEGALYDSQNKIITDGAEQILLANRPSFAGRFKDITVAVHEWDDARKALQDAHAKIVDFASAGNAKVDYIVAAGNVLPETLDAMLEKVKSGATLLVKIDSLWAARLRSREILSEDIVEWGAPQSGGWIGNGFGYIDHFAGDTGLLGNRTVSLNGWEVNGKGLNGFYPFKSKYTTSVYGVYVARPDVIRVLIGAVDYGKGHILLNAAYPVDIQSPLNDLLFYNQMIKL